MFPHHENELAQSQAFMGACCSDPTHTNAPLISSTAAGVVASRSGGSGEQQSGSSDKPHDFVRFWMHNGFVNVDSEKMSKSVGNFFTIREVSGATCVVGVQAMPQRESKLAPVGALLACFVLIDGPK